MNGKNLFLLVVGTIIVSVLSSGYSSVFSTQQTVTNEVHIEGKDDSIEVLLTPSLDSEELKTPVSTEYSPVYVYDEIEPKDFEDGVVLKIPSLSIDTKIQIACYDEEGIYDFSGLEESPVLVCTGASESLSNIGIPGVSIILGHRQWGIVPKIFAHLDKLKKGEIVSVVTNEKSLDFKVAETIIISPEELWNTVDLYHIEGVNNEKAFLILITCTPYGTDLKRLLVVLERSSRNGVPTYSSCYSCS